LYTVQPLVLEPERKREREREKERETVLDREKYHKEPEIVPSA
jgi:hypothetical protein